MEDETRWVAGDTENKWDNTTFKRAPQWMTVLYGYERDAALDEILAPSEAARIILGQYREDGEMDLTLSGVLKVLNGSDTDAKYKTLLALHRRSYHKNEDDMKDLLKRSGVPLHALSILKGDFEKM